MNLKLTHAMNIQSIKAFSAIICVMLSICVQAASDTTAYQPKLGDILFQDLDCGEFCEGVDKVTRGDSGAKFNHVAIMVDPKQGRLIEAIPPVVQEITLDKFLDRSKDHQGRAKVFVYRLKARYQRTIPAAITYIRRQVGLPYDDAFLMPGNAFYCTSLIYAGFAEQLDNPFQLKPMTFKDPKTGKLARVWAEYFAGLGVKAPEGALGINPGAMSQSHALDLVVQFGLPDGYQEQ